ncbi:hypothetical protein AN958_09000 [Leucoagaricus sp. SymC.cos]|nr:hypothetical protein AN958_09000 [Leucoagaricus sp. SymC.cos]
MAIDTDVLSTVGYDFIIKVVRIAFECAFYGIYLLLISASTVILFRKIYYYKSKAACFLLFITIIMFGSSTVFLTMDLIDIVKRLQIILVDHPERSLQEKKDLADTTLQPWMWTGEMFFIFILILGDSVVIWRTWGIFRSAENFLIAPLLTWIGSVVAAFYELGCDVRHHWTVESNDPSAGSVGIKSCAKADTASFSLSYATNIICTILIMYKAWMYRRSMAQYLGSAHRRTQVEKIMILLIESGAVYLALYTFQAVPIYGGSFSAGSFVAVEAVNAIIQQAMGMYPTAIVVLVEMQKSLYDTEQVSRERGLPARSTIVFAAHELTSTRGNITTTHSIEQFDGSTAFRSTANASRSTKSTKFESELGSV